MSDETVVSTQELRKTYRSGVLGRRNVEALRGVSLDAVKGEVFGLLGPNGAGKTTLIKILLGVLRSSGGKGTMLGQPIGSPEARRRVGYLPENLQMDRHHTARTALSFYGRLSKLDHQTIQRRGDELLELVQLSGRDREPVRRFSKGMRQRLGLAQALLHDPDLLILDEPTDGLDPVGRNDVRMMLEQLRDQGKTIFLNSHILQEVELICDRVAIMAKGQLRAIGAISDLTGDTDTGMVRYRIGIHQQDSSTDPSAIAADMFGEEASEIRVVDKLPGFDGDGNSEVVEVVVQAQPQSDVNARVDAIRSAGYSLVSLQQQRRSLEDVFLQVVRPDEVHQESA